MNRRSLIRAALGGIAALPLTRTLGHAAPTNGAADEPPRNSGYVIEEDPGVQCALQFRDSLCGYPGPAKRCDKTFHGPEGCLALGNDERFAGFPLGALTPKGARW